MTIFEVVANIDELDENSVIYAERISGQFLPSSKVAVLNLNDEDFALPPKEISEKYCPGFDYFLEVDIIIETLEDLAVSEENAALNRKIERVIYYAEYDA